MGIQEIVTLRGTPLRGNFLVPEPTLKTNPFKLISMVVEWRWRDRGERAESEAATKSEDTKMEALVAFKG